MVAKEWRSRVLRGARRWARGSLALLALSVAPACAADLRDDPALVALLRDALAARPGLQRAHAEADAAALRVQQQGALPDPVLAFGIQNDGFRRLQIGQMETSYWSVVLGQTIPWFGKRGARTRVEEFGARQAGTVVDRARLSLEAEVERAYLDLVLVREQARVVAEQESLWARAEQMTRVRYEAGEGAQSDVLRAGLERARLRQKRWSLEAEQRRQVLAVNLAAGRPLEQPVETSMSLAALGDPPLTDSASADSAARARSPELARARAEAAQAQARVALARKDLYPDLTLTAGVMPRGGSFEPMWQAGVSLSLPLWAGRKQSAAVAESRLRDDAAQHGVEEMSRLVWQRVAERRAVLGALRDVTQAYRTSVLIQSEATVASTLSQYQVGQVPFTAVLDALNGYLGDRLGYDDAVAEAHRLAIAEREVSLDPAAAVSAGGAGGAMGAGSAAGGLGAPAAGAAPAGAAPASSSPMTRR